METFKIMNNFFGMYVNDQLSLLYLFDRVLVANKKKNMSKVLNAEFGDYISVVSTLVANKGLYKDLSISEKRYVKYNTLLGFKDILEHHIKSDNYYEEVKAVLINNSKDDELDIDAEFKKYFAPTHVANTEFMKFYNGFSKLTSEEQLDLIKQFIKNYKYCKLFNSRTSLSYPDELLSYYDAAVIDLLKQYTVNYQMFYPDEKLAVINIINNSCLDAKEKSGGEYEYSPENGTKSIINHISFMINTLYKGVIEEKAKHTYEESKMNM